MYKYASPYSTAAFLNRSKFSYKKYSKEGSEESLVIRDIIFHYPGLDSHSMCFWTWTDSRRGEWVDCGAGRSPYVGAEGPAVLDVEEKGVGDGDTFPAPGEVDGRTLFFRPFLLVNLFQPVLPTLVLV